MTTIIENKYTTLQEVKEYARQFHNQYYMAMFCEIGYHAVRGGGYTLIINGYVGTMKLTNKKLNFFPLFENDIEASHAVQIFSLLNKNFKNRGHLKIYDFLPLVV